MNSYELVVRRIGGVETVNTVFTDIYTAVQGRAELVAAFKSRGFVGSRNQAAHYRLSKFDRDTMSRVRLDIFIRTTAGFSRN